MAELQCNIAVFVFDTVTRSHPFRLFVKFSRDDTRKKTFQHIVFQHIIKPRNYLCVHDVDFRTFQEIVAQSGYFRFY